MAMSSDDEYADGFLQENGFDDIIDYAEELLGNETFNL
jgi:hypothetical protein